MKERPILFKSEMVRAILDGRKTQTRRIVKPQPINRERVYGPDSWFWMGGKGLLRASYGADYVDSCWTAVEKAMLKVCRYQIGQRLWVKETFQVCEWFQDHWEPAVLSQQVQRVHKFYAADGVLPDQDGIVWRPSIFMPRWASRLTLEITAVRVERLQEITEDDAEDEGALVGFDDHPEPPSATSAYQTLWNSINGPDSWDSNPWVWVIEFRRVQP